MSPSNPDRSDAPKDRQDTGQQVPALSSALQRLSNVAGHVTSSSSSAADRHRPNIHQLSPTHWLPRAAAIGPNATACHHRTATGVRVSYTYAHMARRACGVAYYLKQRGLRRVGILAPNTPGFLECVFAIGAAGAVNVAVNYRLTAEEVGYILDHAQVDSVIVDAEYEGLLGVFRATHPDVHVVVDADDDGERGPYAEAMRAGWRYDQALGGHGWDGLETQVSDEEALICLVYTSGTTARPKGVEYTHRGAYLSSIANVIESDLNYHRPGMDRCHYLWTQPMFHAAGWTFPWAVTAVRGTHYMLRKVDYPQIWSLLKDHGISHYNAAPTVNTLLCSDGNAVKLDGEWCGARTWSDC